MVLSCQCMGVTKYQGITVFFNHKPQKSEVGRSLHLESLFNNAFTGLYLLGMFATVQCTAQALPQSYHVVLCGILER